jgi:hypothetical protein
VKKTGTEPLEAEDAPYVHGRIVFIGAWDREKLTVGFVGRDVDGQLYSNSAGANVSPDGGGGLTNLSFEPQITGLTNDKEHGPGYRHLKMKPGEYLIYVTRNAATADWKKIQVKEGDQLAIDLTIDPAKCGDLVVTLPDEEANDKFEWGVLVVPKIEGMPDLSGQFGFSGEPVKMGTKTVTIKGVLAGKYRVARGKSEADAEVVAGKSTAVTLVRDGAKMK